MTSNHIAIIGGTGFETLPEEIYAEAVDIDTEFGAARVYSVSNNYVEPYKLYFLSRHGATHGLAPHQINYRANIAALVELGVSDILASNAVGSLREELEPGMLILFNDFIDFTRERHLTYFTDSTPWRHTDFTMPYAQHLRRAILEAAQQLFLPTLLSATYLCTDGPRFETPAEVRLFASWGADVVGMTGLPEAIYAREAGMNYAALGIITNFAAGLTQNSISHEEVVTQMRQKLPIVRELMMIASGVVVSQRPV